MAKAGERANTLDMVKARRGRMEYWQRKPRRMGPGRAAHRRKSSIDKERPMASIKTPTPCSNWVVVIQLREGGWKKAREAERRAHRGKSMVPISATRSMVVMVVVGGEEAANAEAEEEA